MKPKLISFDHDDIYRCAVYIENVAEQFSNRAEFIVSVCELLKERQKITDSPQTHRKETQPPPK